MVAVLWLLPDLHCPSQQESLAPTQILGKLETRFIINMDYEKIHSVHKHLKKGFKISFPLLSIVSF